MTEELIQCANPECAIVLDDAMKTYKRDGKVYCEICIDVLFPDREMEEDDESQTGTPAPEFQFKEWKKS